MQEQPENHAEETHEQKVERLQKEIDEEKKEQKKRIEKEKQIEKKIKEEKKQVEIEKEMKIKEEEAKKQFEEETKEKEQIGKLAKEKIDEIVQESIKEEPEEEPVEIQEKPQEEIKVADNISILPSGKQKEVLIKIHHEFDEQIAVTLKKLHTSILMLSVTLILIIFLMITTGAIVFLNLGDIDLWVKGVINYAGGSFG